MSEFFDTASLDDIDADGFDVYVQWLYRRVILVYQADKGDDKFCCSILTDAHIVCEFLKNIGFMKILREEIIQCSFNMTVESREKLVITAYQKTGQPCDLRKFLIELYALQNEPASFFRKAAPPEVYVDILACLLEKARAQNDKHVWSSMSAAGYIEQGEVGTDEFGEAGDNDVEG
ncbi:hypothetical protein G6011_11367 [Alternaria panax]|uniref:Uncharacterized protein n=1 Tax=Alternaria panax TaxID=48097 RepID=A0AAD4IDD0_9PLEO|nr:hypothetical protein G6011_11367 [Alternaria panax]